MSSVGNILLEKEILLESGTNELEILVFRLADYNFGINVAKVREVLPATDITSLPKAHPSVMGVFRLRDVVVPCVSLRKHLAVEPAAADIEQALILTDFNYNQTAFVVDAVERIHRMSWENILAVPNLGALAQTPVTAVARIDGRLVIMLDFEMISDQVTEQFYRTGPVENPLGLPREELRILMADDSPTVRQAIETTLRTSGYTNLEIFENGEQVWLWLEQRIGETGQLSEVADLLISDVEMPRIDGLHLTKRIKEHPQLKQLPVMLYSSIVTPDNKKKGEAVGANAQVAKPELAKVVELADNLIAKSHKENGRQMMAKPQAELPPPPSQEIPQSDPQEQEKSNPPQAQTNAQQPRDVAPPQAPAPEPAPEPTTSPSSSVQLPANTQLWYTFRAELSDRVRHMTKLYEKASQGTGDESVRDDVFRTLHTIKSAAMVIPLDTATRATHLIESLMEATRQNIEDWPLEALEQYLEWLETLADPNVDPQVALQAGEELERQLQAKA